MSRRAAAGLAAAALAVAGCGDAEPKRAAAPAAKPVGPENQGSVVQFADCADWKQGSTAEKKATVVALRGQLTPQNSADAASPLPDDRAFDILEKTCTESGIDSLRLYKLYVRVQAYAPVDPLSD